MKYILVVLLAAASLSGQTQPPTASEAYHLQQDCAERGNRLVNEYKHEVPEKAGFLRTVTMKPRYNPLENKCYVRMEVITAKLDSAGNVSPDAVFYFTFYNGQTQEILADYFINNGLFSPSSEPTECNLIFSDPKLSRDGAALKAEWCLEPKIDACLSGKKCELNQ